MMNGAMETPAITQSGYRSPVVIQAGFVIDDTEHIDTIYSGQVLNINKNAKTGDCQITCSDPSQQIRDESVINFGIDKRIEIEPSGGNLHGNYPFFIGLTEPSESSIFGEGLTRKNTLRTEGALDETNFAQIASGIETEGGPLSNDPILQFKSPFRSRTVESVIKKLLEKYNIINSEIKVPIATNINGNFFTNLGRPSYETNFRLDNYKGAWSATETYNAGDVVRGFDDKSYTARTTVTGGNNPGAGGSIPTAWLETPDVGIWQWPGVVTDMIADETNKILYLLISATGPIISQPETPNPKPRIIKWNLATDEQETLVIISAAGADTIEGAWRFVSNSNFTEFYVLGSQPVYINAVRSRSSGYTTRPGFEFGSYDSSEYNNVSRSKVRIHKISNAQTSPARSTYIDPASIGSNLYPQLAMHYHLGFRASSSSSQNRLPNRYGNLPDSRRNFYLSNNGSDLYYPYANRTTFGVAKATSANTASSIISSGRDVDGFNLANFDFWIDETNSHVFLAYTNIARNSSRFRIIRGNL